jgi:hypothetical protein
MTPDDAKYFPTYFTNKYESPDHCHVCKKRVKTKQKNYWLLSPTVRNISRVSNINNVTGIGYNDKTNAVSGTGSTDTFFIDRIP